MEDQASGNQVEISCPTEAFGPLPDRVGVCSIAPALLRQPGRIIYQLHQPTTAKGMGGRLMTIAVMCLVGYGFIVGSFSGAEQLWAAPLKIAAGALLTAAICLPSFYVFACLGGANEKLRLDSLAGLLMAVVALSALLLVSFAPIAWVFSQSTDSIPLIATMHLLFWVIGLCFGLKLISFGARFLGIVDRGYLLLWMAVFSLVSFQMMTALRPIVGRADHFFPIEKQFFLSHWLEMFAATR
jgi:hypothetical protein